MKQLSEVERAANVARSTASPYGPGLHQVTGRDRRGWFTTACGCPLGRAHALGARGKRTADPSTSRSLRATPRG